MIYTSIKIIIFEIKYLYIKIHWDNELIVSTKNNVGEEGTGKIYIMEKDNRSWFKKVIDMISKIFQQKIK